MSDATFRGDCDRCAALCCVALSFDRGSHFAFDKASDETCRHLDGTRCAIHDRLPGEGMNGCAAYDCLGAGQLATAMFKGLDIGVPSIRRARFDAFRRLREVQALRWALSRYDLEVSMPQTYADLLRFDVAALRANAEATVRAQPLLLCNVAATIWPACGPRLPFSSA